MAFPPSPERTLLIDFQWQAVGAGLFTALGIHIVLTAFGLGLAFLMETSSVWGLLLWSGIAWIAASFVGGYVTAWVADGTRYPEGLFHGLVLWGALTFALLFLPPSTMGLGTTGSDGSPPPNLIASVAWFIAIGGFLSFWTTLWGTLIGSRVAERVDSKAAESYRAA